MRFLLLFLLIPILFSFTSCVSLAEKNSESTELQQKTTIITESADFASAEYNSWLKTPPADGAPVFFAYTSRRAYRDEEKPLCLLNAASQASKFMKVSVYSSFYSKQVNSSIKYAQDLKLEWNREIESDLIDDLEIIEILQDHDGTYMLVRFNNRKINIPQAYKPSVSRGEPSWVLNPPEIPGWIVGVGTVLQTGYMAKSFEAADNQALEQIARQISVDSRDSEKVIENGRGSATINNNIEISEAEIEGFYVIERWYSPDKRYFHSLAVAPETNRR